MNQPVMRIHRYREAAVKPPPATMLDTPPTYRGTAGLRATPASRVASRSTSSKSASDLGTACVVTHEHHSRHRHARASCVEPEPKRAIAAAGVEHRGTCRSVRRLHDQCLGHSSPPGVLLVPGSRFTLISPDSASTTHTTTFAACTSRPAQLRSFAIGRLLYAVVVVPRAVAAARLHQRPTIAWGTGHNYHHDRATTSIWSR
jgi:hypothetical protein